MTDLVRKKVEGVGEYHGAAGGWGALKAVADAVRGQLAVVDETRGLLTMNQPAGFDCPGCAWPDPKHTSSFEFCENGAKAVSWEATSKRTTPEFFADHTVSELWEWHDHDLENHGRLTHPVAYDAASDKFVALSWEDAMARIGAGLQALPDPNMAEFYTSGRCSNEAAFLYQLFVREYGTNNFPDCSNMCHEATSVGLPKSIGIGKGTVTLEDFDHADAIFCIGHNPGTNHPRMLNTLRACSKRGAAIVSINPLRERGLERFISPQHPSEMLTGNATQLSSVYYQIKVGGDLAVLKGMMKTVVALDAESRASGGPDVIDRAFIAEHTDGIDDLLADLDATSWDMIEASSGISAVSMPMPRASSSITAWASHSIAMAWRMCSTSPIFCCCGAISVGPVPGSRRCAGIPMCRAIARSASPNCRMMRCSMASSACSASIRRARMVMMRWLQ
jgi:molybdopterin-dependent oxidoreductase alpha subunit